VPDAGSSTNEMPDKYQIGGSEVISKNIQSVKSSRCRTGSELRNIEYRTKNIRLAVASVTTGSSIYVEYIRQIHPNLKKRTQSVPSIRQKECRMPDLRQTKCRTGLFRIEQYGMRSPWGAPCGAYCVKRFEKTNPIRQTECRTSFT
jgi:hypothetical protein